MPRYPETTPEQRQRYVDVIDRRWKQLHDMGVDWGDRAYKYLLLVNSGGAVAILGFLGTDSAKHVWLARVALAFFVVGLILVGVEIARRVHHTENLYARYRRDAMDFFEGKIEYQELRNADENRSRKPPLAAYLLPYFSFGFFVIGCLIAAYALSGMPSPK